MSFATVPARFPDDERTCKALCPATEATLFTYRNPGEDINQAVSISGQPYSSLPNAFKFRTEFNPSCACKAAGQTWSDALKTIDDKAAAEQGDIIVTEESAKRMARPPAAEGRPRQEGRDDGDCAALRLPRQRRRQPTQRVPPRTSRSARSARPSSRQSTGGALSLLRSPDGAIGAAQSDAPLAQSGIGPACARAPDCAHRSTLAPTASLHPGYEELNSYPSNASAEPRAARDTSASSGAGSALPVSRKLLVMG